MVKNSVYFFFIYFEKINSTPVESRANMCPQNIFKHPMCPSCCPFKGGDSAVVDSLFAVSSTVFYMCVCVCARILCLVLAFYVVLVSNQATVLQW